MAENIPDEWLPIPIDSAERWTYIEPIETINALEDKTMADQLYPCSRCSGQGRITAFGHVLAGVCFQCKGSGKQKTKPAPKAVKWAVFGHDRNTDKPGRLYNVKAPTEAKAIAKARNTFDNASTEFRNTWTMSKAFALTWEELENA